MEEDFSQLTMASPAMPALPVAAPVPSGIVNVWEMTDKEAYLEQVLKFNESLSKENRLLEAYLMRVSPSTLLAEDEEPKTRKRMLRKLRGAGDDVKRVERRMTTDEKFDIACAELDVLRDETEKVKADCDMFLDNLSSAMEDADVRMAETKKETYEFKRDVIIGAENYRTGKIKAEKVIRYLEDKLRGKDALVEKLKLKNITLKSQTQRYEQQLRQKEEMGEVLHVVDFEQLKIQNQQHLQKIEERNNELLRLKITTGKTVQVLNNLKRKLNALAYQNQYLKRAIVERTFQIKQHHENIRQATKEQIAAERQNRLLLQEQEDIELPSVIDYIRLKSQMMDVEKKSTDWERKVELAELESKKQRKLSGATTALYLPSTKLSPTRTVLARSRAWLFFPSRLSSSSPPLPIARARERIGVQNVNIILRPGSATCQVVGEKGEGPMDPNFRRLSYVR
ncbi:hypothetical protein CBR_g12701 [Chara braunii]|uniref:Cilia- and flagella-associated protein 263 n=1 Tax=Chara braunii TaxID=69332 RepID=A0A388KSS2_CHABU|nr:hypothetical protein CBR_g12701 [Chara braunii]|eukprot:GBG72983.1 hypothetical protein CBR_g12701 [Chara braunii]